MEPLSISKILPKALKIAGIYEKVEEYKAVVLWYSVACNLALKTEPVGIYQGRMTINVTDSVLLHQLTFFKRQYIEKINLLLGRNVVKDIIFKIGIVEKKGISDESQEEYSKRFNSIQLDQDELDKIDEIVNIVEDLELRDLLRNLFVKQTKFYKMNGE